MSSPYLIIPSLSPCFPPSLSPPCVDRALSLPLCDHDGGTDPSCNHEGGTATCSLQLDERHFSGTNAIRPAQGLRPNGNPAYRRSRFKSQQTLPSLSPCLPLPAVPCPALHPGVQDVEAARRAGASGFEGSRRALPAARRRQLTSASGGLALPATAGVAAR